MYRLQDSQAEARLLDYREAGPDYGPDELESPKLLLNCAPAVHSQGLIDDVTGFI